MKNYEKIHTFDNGIKVFDYHLLDIQRERYKQNNVHEAEEEEIFIDIISHLPQKFVYVNVGAAIGYYSILAKKLRKDGQIFSFEPMKKHRKYFKENIILNSLKPRDITIIKEGIFIKKGFIKFKLHDYGSMILPDDNEVSIWKKMLEVMSNTRIKTITMSDIFRRIDQEHVDLLQMDIQGLEHQVLEQASSILQNKRIENFLIGTHSKKIHNDCIELLKNNNYKIVVDNFDTKLQPDGIVYAALEQGNI